MKRRYSLTYFLGQSVKGLWRNGVMSFASIAVLLSCLVVMGSFSMLVYNINYNLEKLGLLNEIVAYVNDDRTPEEVEELQNAIESLDNVKTVVLTTKAEALQNMKEQASDYPHLYDDLDNENPLPDKFTITYLDNSMVANLVYQIGQMKGIGSVDDRTDIATSLENLKNGVSFVFLWFLLILFIVSIFVIINTIKLAVFARRQEITVMRYVGATNWFITLPFVFEGMFIGLIASLLGYLAQWYLYGYVQKMLTSTAKMIAVVPFGDVWQIVCGGFLLVGVLTGVVGSCISLRKYLKA